jgi:hypothetical protein
VLPRKYREEEIQEIFERAANREDPKSPALLPGNGLSLAELQDIGLEVGLAPDRIAEATAALDLRRAVLPRRTQWGMPVSVGRIVELAREPTDREWDVLVAELRQTFGARGKITYHGGLREWSNGNLHAYVEPSESGYRLRLGTLKGNAMALNAMGIACLAMGAISFAALLVSGGLPQGIFMPAVLGASGVGAFASNMLRLPRWAKQREEQMEYIAGRASALIAAKSE